MFGYGNSTKSRGLCRLAVAFILAVVMVFSLAACNKKSDGTTLKSSAGALPIDTPAVMGDAGLSDPTSVPSNAFVNKYAATTQVGYFGKITKTSVPINKPVAESKNEGLESYPTYGTNYKGGVAQDLIIAESGRLTASGTKNAGGGGYTWMAADGTLHSGTRSNEGEYSGIPKLYKHTAAEGNYHGNVSDTEARVEKTVTIRPRGYGSYSVTGIYAPAGEVITIKISGKDMNATGGLTVHIGQALYNGQANNIWAGKAMPRMPHLLNTMDVNKNTAVYDDASDTWTAYVGSFLGGPLYIRNTNATFTATISGGVEYLHFILGYTQKEEFERLKANCSAPYFDLEVWNYGVLLSGARRNAERFTYDDLYKAANLWEKITQVTTIRSNQGIVMLFEPFVAAGAAVAFPGRSSVNCPEGWMANSLDYNLMVTSGAWGNFHEYHHNFQGFGVGDGGEVTNNSLTLVSYALFTKISEARGINNFGAGSLSGWNTYTSATWALNETLKIARANENPSNGNKGLALYATLLHNFGANEFMQASVAGGGQSYAGYKQAWEKVTQNNMDYYFNEILKGNTGVSDTAKSYPMFVPVSSVYQTGRSFTVGGVKKYATTMRPYLIPNDAPFTIDFTKYTVSDGQYKSGSIVIPDGFTYSIKSITKPKRGTLKITDNFTAVYTPDPKYPNETSGQMVVTLSITKNNKAFKVKDVDLVLEFKPTGELNKNTLERTTYLYSGSGDAYTDATEAFDAGFAGYSGNTFDHTNFTQNANTDLWFRGADNEATHKQFPNALDRYFIKENEIDVIDGKLYFENDGKYRVFLRGRTNCALYFSVGGTSYSLGAKVTNGSGSAFYTGNEQTFFDVEFSEGKVTVYKGDEVIGSGTLTGKNGNKAANWLYIKEVLLTKIVGGVVPFLGVGTGTWTESMFTVRESYYNASGSAVESAESEGYAYTETTYSDMQGTPVAVEKRPLSGETEYFKLTNGSRTKITLSEFSELTAHKLIAPTTASYANAFRRSYELTDNSNFTSDYFFTRSYSYNYSDNGQLGVGTQSVVVDQCKNLNLHTGWGGNNLSVIIDGIRDKGDGLQLHMNRKPSEENPFTLVVDLGKEVAANRFVLYSQAGRTDPQFPKSFRLYASLDGTDYTLIDEFTDIPYASGKMSVDFPETQMRYYKLEVTDSTNQYLIIREIEMWKIFEVNGGKQISPDNSKLIYEGDWSIVNTPSTFGHAYLGKSGSTLKFNFSGKRLGIFTPNSQSGNFEVYVDGNKVESVGLKTESGLTKLAYLSSSLSSGSHNVEIRCTGDFALDSIVIFQ